MVRRWALPAGLMAVPVVLAVTVVVLLGRTGLWASTWTLLVSTVVGAVVGALLAGSGPVWWSGG